MRASFGRTSEQSNARSSWGAAQGGEGERGPGHRDLLALALEEVVEDALELVVVDSAGAHWVR